MRSGASLPLNFQRGRNPARADRRRPAFCLPPRTNERTNGTVVPGTLSIYLLNLFLAFITPKFDPALEADLAETDAEEGAPTLPTSKGDVQEDGEFRPFIRRLPEFKFWFVPASSTPRFAPARWLNHVRTHTKPPCRYSATKAITLAFFAAFIPVFDVPVFWPILVMYFCILTFITLRRQVAHMRKYKCVPASTPPRSSGSPTSCVTRPGVLMVLGVFPRAQIPPFRHGSEIDIRSLKRGGGGGRCAKARRDERTLLGGYMGTVTCCLQSLSTPSSLHESLCKSCSPPQTFWLFLCGVFGLPSNLGQPGPLDLVRPNRGTAGTKSLLRCAWRSSVSLSLSEDCPSSERSRALSEATFSPCALRIRARRCSFTAREQT